MASGWSLKAYEITLDGRQVDGLVREAAARLAERSLKPIDGRSVGFLILHLGTEAVWLLIDSWNEDILSQSTHFASLDNLTNFEMVEAGGPTACVWELPVHSYERDSYVRCVLDPTDGPDYAGYLDDQLRIEP